MPSKSEHMIIGGVIGLACYLGQKNLTRTTPSLPGTVASTLLGGIAGTLPDIIEPATNTNHRGLFHSVVFGTGLSYILKDIAKSNLSGEGKLLSAILGFGYLSHLSMDSKTSRGLPAI